MIIDAPLGNADNLSARTRSERAGQLLAPHVRLLACFFYLTDFLKPAATASTSDTKQASAFVRR